MSTVQQTIDALQPLAQKLGQGAEQLFRIYTKQAIINGVTEIVLGTFALVAFGLGFKLAYKKAKAHDKKDRYENYVTPTLILGSIMGAIVVFAAVWAIADGINELLNPQYVALHNIITDVSGQVN